MKDDAKTRKHETAETRRHCDKKIAQRTSPCRPFTESPCLLFFILPLVSCGVAQAWKERSSHKRKVAGSNPASATNNQSRVASLESRAKTETRTHKSRLVTCDSRLVTLDLI